MRNAKKRSDLLDFEIRFYEQLVEKYPGFVDALVALAEAYTRKGATEKGLEIDRRLSEIKKKDPFVWYNLSCSYSLLNRLDEAFEAMNRAIEYGYDDLNHLKRDADLSNLRRSKYFSEIIESIRKQKFSATN